MRHPLLPVLALLVLAGCDRLGIPAPDNGGVNLNDLEVHEEPPPAEEPPPSMSGETPPPVVGSRPPDGPAPGGGDVADGPDAGAGASDRGGSRARVAAGSLARYITGDDYPAAAMRNNEQGRVAFVLEIGANGRVTSCAVTESSGSRQLDNTTCLIMQSRARYTPARNARGMAVADRDRGVVRWQLPEG